MIFSHNEKLLTVSFCDNKFKIIKTFGESWIQMFTGFPGDQFVPFYPPEEGMMISLGENIWLFNHKTFQEDDF